MHRKIPDMIERGKMKLPSEGSSVQVFTVTVTATTLARPKFGAQGRKDHCMSHLPGTRAIDFLCPHIFL
jgi:hypothetical protein